MDTAGDDETVFVANVNGDENDDGRTDDDDGSERATPCEHAAEEMLPWLDEQAG